MPLDRESWYSFLSFFLLIARSLQVDTSALRAPETPYMQGVLECLHILGVRFPNLASVVQQTLDNITAAYPNNEPLVSR